MELLKKDVNAGKSEGHVQVIQSLRRKRQNEKGRNYKIFAFLPPPVGDEP